MPNKQNSAPSEGEVISLQPMLIETDKLQSILDTAGLQGTLLLFNSKEKQYYVNQKENAQIGHIPASTFKIQNSIIGLESGAISMDSVFKWDGEQYFLDAWEQDLSVKNAFSTSCVPCYQQLAKSIGVDTMKYYLKQLNYPFQEVTNSNLDTFWLRGTARITPMQQILFLRNLHNKFLPIQPETYKNIHEIMQIDTFNDNTLYGKTGLSIGNDSSDRNGWFVGFVTTPDKTVYFATNLEYSPSISFEEFNAARVELTKQALADYGIVLK